MSQQKKNFKGKSSLRCMADGGAVEKPSMWERLKNYGQGGGSERQRQIEEAANGPAPTAAPKPTGPVEMEHYVTPEGKISTRPKTEGLANGGMPKSSKLRAPRSNGGSVKGEGGPTEDKVGPIALSAEEFVLPADTVKAVGKENLESLVEDTHEYVGGPKTVSMESHGINRNGSPLRMANGGVVLDDPLKIKPPALRVQPPVPQVGSGGAGAPPNTPRPVGTVGGSNLPVPRQTNFDVTNYTPKAASTGPVSGGPVGPANPPGGRVGNTYDMEKTKSPSRFGGAAATAGLVGAADSIAENYNGVREQKLRDMGIGPDAGVGETILGDTARTFANVGDAATLGVAGSLGRTIANGGTSPDDEPAPQGAFPSAASPAPVGRDPDVPFAPGQEPQASATVPQASAPAAQPVVKVPAPVQQNTDPRAQRLREMGVSDAEQAEPVVGDAKTVIQAGSPTNVNLGGGIFGKSDTPGGKANNFSGVGDPNSQYAGKTNLVNMAEGTDAIARANEIRRGTLRMMAGGPEGAANKRRIQQEADVRHIKYEMEHATKPQQLSALRKQLSATMEQQGTEGENYRQASADSTDRYSSDNSLAGTMYTADANAAKSAGTNALALQKAQDAAQIQKGEDINKDFANVAKTFAAGDEALESKTLAMLQVLPQEQLDSLYAADPITRQGLIREIVDSHKGVSDVQEASTTFGKDTGAVAQNTVAGGAIGAGAGRMLNALSPAIAKIPKVGAPLSALAKFGGGYLAPAVGAAAGFAATPDKTPSGRLATTQLDAKGNPVAPSVGMDDIIRNGLYDAVRGDVRLGDGSIIKLSDMTQDQQQAFLAASRSQAYGEEQAALRRKMDAAQANKEANR